MKTAIVTSLFGLVVASTLFAAGCGGSGGGAVKMLPEDSTVTLEKVKSPDNDAEGRLYIGDTSTGEIFRVKTKPDSWLSAYQWVSPSELMTAGYYHDYYLLDLTAKTLHRLPGGVADSAVTFSHSGELMATTGPTGELMIWSVEDNAQVAQIPAGPVGYTVWSPDDKHIFWSGAPAGIASVGPQPVVVTADMGEGALSAAWSRDGTSVIFRGADGVYSIDADSGAKTLLYTFPAGLEAVPDPPEMSPDGKYALVSARDASGSGLRAIIVPLDGSTGAQVTSVWPQDAAWSPAENVVAVVGDWCREESRLLLLNADGSVRSTFEGATQIPVFSVDGSTIAYVGADPAGEADEGLVVRDVDGENVVAFLPGFLRTDVWSPDGRWLAYTPGPLSYQCAEFAGTTEILPFP
jgi:Tol biopolymer transport system component